MNLEQLRKQAKEPRPGSTRRAIRQALERLGDLPVRLSSGQLVLARSTAISSWPKLKAYVERLGLEQPFHTDLDYYEGRADGIATTGGLSRAEARRELARRHGFAGWPQLRRHVQALASGEEPPTPFVLAYRAVEAGDRAELVSLLDRDPELVRQRGTNGNDLLGMAKDLELVRLLLERGADPNRGNDYGWTKLHQAGYSNRRELAALLLEAGGRTDLSARGDGGTPLVVALFWGHREVVDLLGRGAANLRVAAGPRATSDLIRALVGTPAAGAHREFYRPHGGFPAWAPSDDPQEVLDEALVWAAKADRAEALPLLVELGARVDADPYRGTRARPGRPSNGRVASIRTLVELGADPNQRGTFGGPTHGEGVTALHLAAQSGRREAAHTLVELGADPTAPRLASRRRRLRLGELRRPRELAEELAEGLRLRPEREPCSVA